MEAENRDSPKPKTPKNWQGYWQKEKDAADKRLRKFRKQGAEIVRRFLDERENSGSDSLYSVGWRGDQPQRLNLFHKNVSTLQDMLFGQTPKIDVSREHHDPDDDQARVAGLMFQRILEADTRPSGDKLGTALRAALQDRLLPGLGMGRVRYEIEEGTVTQRYTNMDGEEIEEEVNVLISEDCIIDYVHWQDCLWGWSRTWADLPWFGYRAYLSKEEATARFGADIANNLTYENQTSSGVEPSGDTYDNPDKKDNVQKAEIWEFWHKKEKKVFWWAQGQNKPLDVKDDPLGLDGFFPSPRPLVANPTTTLFLPRADFILAQDLYNEIDILQSRISTITDAVKVVGVYDKNTGDSVGRMFKEGVENDLIPVDNWAMFAEKGGLQGTIDWFPVQEVVATLQTLISIRDQTIELLYQITGMSDILRGGGTQQYTAASTEALKAKFGSIHVQALQDEFARFASDLDALKAEVISKHFSPQTIYKQANAQFLPQADQQLVQPALMLMKSPDIKWRVNIKPESVAMVDFAQIKAERTEFLTAMATYVQSAQAAAKAIPGSIPVLLELMKWGMAGFKGSDYLEGTMDQAIEMARNAPPSQEGQQQQQAEQMKMQGELQKVQMKAQADLQLENQRFQNEMQKMQADFQQTMAEQNAKSQADLQKIRADLQADLQVIAAKLGADLRVEDAQSTFAVAEKEVEHAYHMTESAQDHRYATLETRQQNREAGSD